MPNGINLLYRLLVLLLHYSFWSLQKVYSLTEYHSFFFFVGSFSSFPFVVSLVPFLVFLLLSFMVPFQVFFFVFCFSIFIFFLNEFSYSNFLSYWGFDSPTFMGNFTMCFISFCFVDIFYFTNGKRTSLSFFFSFLKPWNVFCM